MRRRIAVTPVTKRAMRAEARDSALCESKAMRKYEAIAVKSQKTKMRMRSRAIASPTIEPMKRRMKK
jgi:hypothetical protein